MATKPDDASMLDDYTKATFPLDVKWSGGGSVRLYGTMSGRVFGVSFRVYEKNGETQESFGQSLDWDGQGKYGSAGIAYPTMDLAPPPAKVAERVSAMRAEMREAQARLDAMPDAPSEWRQVDEQRIAILTSQLEQLV